MKTNELPKFGNLQSVRVICAGSVVAAPFACGLLAEQGADVIQIESTRGKDMLRMFGDLYSAEHRNQRNIAMDIPSPEGKEVLLKLIKDSDVLVENSKGGTWAKWGLTDEVLWEVNPRLVIAHISGFGQTGDQRYISRGSFDPIGQAFSGYMAINGEPEPAPPYAPKPFACDYITGLFAAWAILAALYRARETGKGESIDTAQYETMVRIQGNFLLDGVRTGQQPPRMGNKDLISALENVQKCKDGNYVMLALGGYGVLKRVEELWGLGDDPDFAEPHSVVLKADGARAEKFVKAAVNFCRSHTAEEVEQILTDHGVTASRIITYPMMKNEPHYKARQSLIDWEDVSSERVITGPGLIPNFKNNPSKIFRGGPTYGMDSEDILEELGYSKEQIQSLCEKKVIEKV